MPEPGQAHQAPSCTGCHSARKPLAPSKHANPGNCGTLEGQNTLGLKTAKMPNSGLHVYNSTAMETSLDLVTGGGQ